MSDRPSSREVGVFITIAVVAIVGSKLLYGWLAYGDASCGFKNCVEVKVK